MTVGFAAGSTAVGRAVVCWLIPRAVSDELPEQLGDPGPVAYVIVLMGISSKSLVCVNYINYQMF